MSGSIIYTPSTGADWATAWEQVEYTRKGKMGLSLTNYDLTTLPAIASGSWAEVVGSIYKWTSEEAISGSLTSSAINYIKLVPSGSGDTAIVTATWTDSAPMWSDSYQGYYSGTSRYVAGCYYDGTYYTRKFIFDKDKNLLRDFVIDIGDWDMDADPSVPVAHGFLSTSIRTIEAMIRDDVGVMWPLGVIRSAASTIPHGGVYSIDSTNITLVRSASDGLFDTTDFNATSYNRGWITIKVSII